MVPPYDDTSDLQQATPSMQSAGGNQSLEWIIEAPHNNDQGVQSPDLTFTATEATGNDTIIAGRYDSNSTLGDWNITDNGTGGASGFVGILNETGSWQWVATTGGTGDVNINVVTPDGQGGVFVGGSLTNTVDFGSQRTYDSGTTGGEPFVAHLNSTGHWQWVTRATTSNGFSEVNDIAVMSDGGIAVTGDFTHYLRWDGIHEIYSSSGSETSAFVARINASGGPEWWASLGGPNYNQNGNAIVVDSLDNIYVTGRCHDNMNYRLRDITNTDTGAIDHVHE